MRTEWRTITRSQILFATAACAVQCDIAIPWSESVNSCLWSTLNRFATLGRKNGCCKYCCFVTCSWNFHVSILNNPTVIASVTHEVLFPSVTLTHIHPRHIGLVRLSEVTGILYVLESVIEMTISNLCWTTAQIFWTAVESLNCHMMLLNLRAWLSNLGVRLSVSKITVVPKPV